MIVVDANTLLYLIIAGPLSGAAKGVFVKDPDWLAPPLIEHEALNVICTYVRLAKLTRQEGLDALALGRKTVRLSVGAIDPAAVLDLSVSSGCSGYDCEFVALAKSLNVPLVTSDAKLLRAFPGTAVSMDDFLRT